MNLEEELKFYKEELKEEQKKFKNYVSTDLERKEFEFNIIDKAIYLKELKDKIGVIEDTLEREKVKNKSFSDVYKVYLQAKEETRWKEKI